MLVCFAQRAFGFGGLINPSANAIISIYFSDKEQGLVRTASGGAGHFGMEERVVGFYDKLT
jgi:hypothetical protein